VGRDNRCAAGSGWFGEEGEATYCLATEGVVALKAAACGAFKSAISVFVVARNEREEDKGSSP